MSSNSKDLYVFDVVSYAAGAVLGEKVSISEFKSLIAARGLFQIKNSYNKVNLFLPNLELYPRRSLIFAACWWASSEECSCSDSQGRMLKINLLLLLKSFLVLLLKLPYARLAFWRYRRLLSYCSSKPKTPFFDTSEIAVLKLDESSAKFPSGGHTHAEGLIHGLEKLEKKVNFYSCSHTEENESPRLRRIKLTLKPQLSEFVDMARLHSTSHFIEKISEDFDLRKPSMIYQRYTRYSIEGLFLSRKYKLPLVLEYNGSEVWSVKNWGGRCAYPDLLASAEKASLHGADYIVTVSEASRDELIKMKIAAQKILVVPNGADETKFKPDLDGARIRQELAPKASIVVGFIGSFGVWHGADLLAKAFVETSIGSKQRLHLLMIGSGHRIANVRKKLSETGNENYTLTGAVTREKVPQYLAACDILVAPQVPNPDRTEFFGSPTKLFEYMAMGKAIVASRLGQMSQVLDEEKNALLFEPGNSEDLSHQLKRLIQDEGLRQRLGKAARQKLENSYTWEAHCKKILEGIDSMPPNI